MNAQGPNANISVLYDYYDDFNLDSIDYSNWATQPFPDPFSLPSISSVSITPNPAFTDDTLQAVPSGWSDPEGDPEGYTYQWKKNGSNIPGETGETLDGSFFVKDDSITVVVTPFDGTSYGTPKESAPRVISNSPPTAPVVQILPPNPMPGVDIAVDVITYSTDADGDCVAYHFKWYECTNYDPQNPGAETWVHKVEHDDQPSVSGVYLQEGDLWRVDHTPYEVPCKSNSGASLLGPPLEGEAGFDRVYVGDNERPTVMVTNPPSGTNPAGNAYDIQWTSFDANGDDTFVDVYFDEDNIKGGATLVGQYEPDDGIFIWYLENVPSGDYYAFIRITDEKGAIGDDFSDGVVSINQAEEGPSSVENWSLLE